MSQYAELGVDAGKAGVREAFGKVIDNDFPGAWVNIKRLRFPAEFHVQMPVPLVVTQHGDGDGSKQNARILAYRPDFCHLNS